MDKFLVELHYLDRLNVLTYKLIEKSNVAKLHTYSPYVLVIEGENFFHTIHIPQNESNLTIPHLKKKYLGL